MTVLAFEKWMNDQHPEAWDGVDAIFSKPGPKNVSWVATCVCEPLLYVGTKMMFETYKKWIISHGAMAQYDHERSLWYFENEADAILFDFTFS